MGRFDARVVRLVTMTIEDRMVPPIARGDFSETEARLGRIEELLIRADRSASTLAEEVDLVLNGLSREIFRLQAQVEVAPERKGLSTAAVGGPHRSSPTNPKSRPLSSVPGWGERIEIRRIEDRVSERMPGLTPLPVTV